MMFSAQDNFEEFLDQAAFLDKDSNISPVLKDDDESKKIDFSQSNILNFDEEKAADKPEGDLSLALPDLSAIGGETASDDDNNLADLNRKLMPNFVVNVG